MLLQLILAVTGYTTGVISPEPFHDPAEEVTGISDVEYGDPNSGIPVVCYHQISGCTKYSVTPGILRADLEDFWEAGFTLVTTRDLENGLMQFPEGRRPLILTFDDGWQDNFSFIEKADGTFTVDPDCAVAILADFTEEHPDFGGHAIFFISWDKVPFGQEWWLEEKFNILLDVGHEIGNHTWRHRHLMSLPGDQWSPAIIRALEKFDDNLGLRTGGISSVSWPGGSIQDGSWVTERISAMEFQGRPAVGLAFVVDGAVSSFRRVLADADRRIRISRIDMSQYSVGRILQWPNLMTCSVGRSDLHDPLPWRP